LEKEKLHKDLEKGINSKKQEFEIKTTSDKTLPANKVDFILKFNKSESGGVFLNSYNAKLTNDNSEEISHNFPVSRDNSFTAKEAVNLLEGRSVKIEFLNPKSQQVEPAFVQFNFNEPKTEKEIITSKISTKTMVSIRLRLLTNLISYLTDLNGKKAQ
jgi:hypothetical protein